MIILDSERAHAAITGALTGVSPQYAAAAQGVGVSQPVTTAVLLLVADDVDAKKQALKGLRALITYHEHHVLDAKGKIKNQKSFSNGKKLNKVPSFRQGDDAKSDGKSKGGKKKKKQGAITRFFHMFHHLYRPHHHPNHPPARYHNGIEAEVQYHESYSIVGVIKHGKGKKAKITEKKLKMPMPVFRPNMYVVATIKSYDRNTGTYDLTYSSGPYLADENPNGIHLFKGPEDATSAEFHFKGVRPSVITVDLYDNFGSHEPYFILLISLLQTGCFAYWVTMKDDNVGLYSPVSGPEWTWMRIMSDFPNCENLKTDYWRYASYQFVHNGLVHLGCNMFMQILFGLPLNMVHGSLRFGLIYELGVIFGAITFVTFDGGFNSVVGCSGGVYCIFGMHLAEIFINWNLEHRGLMNHWTRLLIMMCVLGVDAYKIYTSPSETTSYSAHGGGIFAGLLCGIVFLDTLETTWCDKWVILPIAKLIMILFPLGMVAYYITEDFPPTPIGEIFFPNGYSDTPCCWQALDCVDDIEKDEFDAMYCKLDADGIVQRLYSEVGDDVLNTCAEMVTAVSDFYSND
jgi:rhomboid-related protein 1/2/3